MHGFWKGSYAKNPMPSTDNIEPLFSTPLGFFVSYALRFCDIIKCLCLFMTNMVPPPLGLMPMRPRWKFEAFLIWSSRCIIDPLRRWLLSDEIIYNSTAISLHQTTINIWSDKGDFLHKWVLPSYWSPGHHSVKRPCGLAVWFALRVTWWARPRVRVTARSHFLSLVPLITSFRSIYHRCCASVHAIPPMASNPHKPSIGWMILTPVLTFSGFSCHRE